MFRVPSIEIGLMLTPVVAASVLIFLPVDLALMNSISSAVAGSTRLEFDSGVQVFGVLADEDQVDLRSAEVRPHALVDLAGPQAGEQPQFLPQKHVDAAEALADRRGDRRLQGDFVACGSNPAPRSGTLPTFSMTSIPHSWTSQSILTPVASTHWRVASAISGPTPSPGIKVT